MATPLAMSSVRPDAPGWEKVKMAKAREEAAAATHRLRAQAKDMLEFRGAFAHAKELGLKVTAE